ncbi:MAG: hypothetical protein ACFFA1_01970 [Promethearchaeota archaeon]
MKQKKLKIATLAMLIALSLTAITPVLAALPDESVFLNGNRFSDTGGWSTTVDWIDLVRNNQDVPAWIKTLLTDVHVHTYIAYVNKLNYQMLYHGFINASVGADALTIPMQTVLQHYETPSGKDVFAVNTFVMLTVFKDLVQNDLPNPLGEPVYLSVSFDISVHGDNFTSFLDEINSENVSVTVYPLTSSNGELHWEWGMKYENLKSLWWRLDPGPLDPIIALAQYSELEFNYTLDIDPTRGTAEVSTNYVIGQPERLWLPNNTYYENTEDSNYNLTSWITEQGFKIGITSYQLTTILNETHENRLDGGNAFTNESESLVNENLSTYVGAEQILDVEFGNKKTYDTYNESTGALTGDDLLTKTWLYPTGRRYVAPGPGNNPLVGIQGLIMAPLPLAAMYMSPALARHYNENYASLNNTLSVDRVDYYYFISYPEWNGSRIVHDPTFIAYADLAAGIFSVNTLILIGTVGVVIVVAVFFVIRRRK